MARDLLVERRSLGAETVQRIFSRYTEQAPTALALRETMRMAMLARILPGEGGTLWDVGCGDGLFWEVFPDRERWQLDGIELSGESTAVARRRGIFREVTCGDITRIAAPPRAYDVVLGNCSLEHVPDIHAALKRMVGAVKPGGLLFLFVPAFQWTQTMGAVRMVGAFSNRLRMAAQGAVDGFFQHHHLYTATTWMRLVEEAGGVLPEAAALGGRELNRLFERHLYLSFPEFLAKTVAGRYPRALWRRRDLPLSVVEELLAPMAEPGGVDCVEYVVAARPPAAREG